MSREVREQTRPPAEGEDVERAAGETREAPDADDEDSPEPEPAREVASCADV